MDATDDALGVRKLGHRRFVGGDGPMWESIGTLQFDFLVGRGLRPHHVLLDFACGSLRGGVHFIPYLEEGNYLGFDKSIDLVALGIFHELGAERFARMRPQFVVNGRFDLSEFTKRPDFVIAQSIFTHLVAADIRRALTAIAAISTPTTEIYATYFRCDRPHRNPERSHSRVNFHYRLEDMLEFGLASGWRIENIGDWNHPRGQHIVRYFR